MESALIKPEPHRICGVCQLQEDPCSKCRSRMGINPEWAAKYLGFTAWKETAPNSKKDREYLINAAIKTAKADAARKGGFIGGEDLWWMAQAKKELLRG